MRRPRVSRWLLENRSNNWKRWATHSWRKLLISWDLTPGTSLTVASSVRQAETMGPEQYQTFMTDPLVKQTTHIREPIKIIKLSLFSRPPQREKSNTSLQVSSLKSDCSRFSRLYIACQSRDGNLQDFFKHENQACPSSLSQIGKLRSGTKADLLGCLESNCAAARGEAPMIWRHNPRWSSGCQLSQTKCRQDFWWICNEDILTPRPGSTATCQSGRRGLGPVQRRRPEILRVDANKAELFTCLAVHLIHLETEKQVVTTNGEDALCNHPRDVSSLAQCNQ